MIVQENCIFASDNIAVYETADIERFKSTSSSYCDVHFIGTKFNFVNACKSSSTLLHYVFIIKMVGNASLCK